VRFTEINLFGVYVVTMAREVAGRIVQLPVADNQ
jgi:multidrug resistance efflux pump